jgi:hypothetical protein
MLLDRYLKELPAGLRPALEKRIERSIVVMLTALRCNKPEQLDLTLLREADNIRAVLDLAQELQARSVYQDGPNEDLI